MPYEASSMLNYEEYKKMALTSYVSMQKGSLAIIFLMELLCIAFIQSDRNENKLLPVHRAKSGV